MFSQILFEVLHVPCPDGGPEHSLYLGNVYQQSERRHDQGFMEEPQQRTSGGYRN